MKNSITNRPSPRVLTFLALLLFGATIGPAAPGDLDPTFGNGGKVNTAGIGGISDIAIQADGKIIAVGGNRIARYNADGSLDSSFGGTGILIIQLGENISASAYSTALQADGKIVVACGSFSVATGYGFAVVRYNPNGTFDTAFNGTGKIIIWDGNDPVWTVAIQTDGKIVLGGGNFANAAIHRFNSNGTPDTSFNGTGSIAPSTSVTSLAIQPHGKIIVGGTAPDSYPDWNNIWISCYNADGSQDNSFGDGGRRYFLTSVDPAAVNGLAIHSDGKIVAKVTGWENGDFGYYPVTFIARLDPTGSQDIFVYEHSLNSAGDVAIQPDGKIVSVRSTAYNGSDFAVRRYNPYGFFDTTFDDGGIVTTDFGSQDEPTAVAIQADGKIVVGGVTRTSQPNGNVIYNFALARYQGGSRTRFDFDGDGRADVSVFRPSDRTWYLNQLADGFSATQWGHSTDKIMPADYDGDGRTDIAVFRDGVWYWLNSSDSSFNVRQFGIASDIPVSADYHTGGGRSELAVYRNGTWWILNLFNDQISTIQFGAASDKPVPADYDGDGRADQAVYRNGEWHLKRSTQGYGVVSWGLATDKPVPADYDGDGKTDPAVYRDGTWYLLQSLHGWREFQWGVASDIPAPADYDGDGRADAAVYRNGTWYLLQSTAGFAAHQFGAVGDKPIPGAFVP